VFKVFLVAAMEGAQCLGSPECHTCWFGRCDPLELELGDRLAADVADGVLWTTFTVSTQCPADMCITSRSGACGLFDDTAYRGKHRASGIDEKINTKHLRNDTERLGTRYSKNPTYLD
jgi:hypothetical protein